MLEYTLKKLYEESPDLFYDKPRGVSYFLAQIAKIDKYIWPSIRTDLHNVFSDKDHPVNEVVKLDGVGSGKSTFAVFTIAYSLYLLGLCKSPAACFGLMPNTKIYLAIASLRERQAKGIIFDQLIAFISENSWFRRNYPHKNESSLEVSFPNKVHLSTGSSSETSQVGFNVLVAVLDEGDWFVKVSRIGDAPDQAENVYTALKDRIETRFGERGLIVLVSSLRVAEGFMYRRFAQVKNSPTGYTTMRAHWDSKPGNWAPYFIVNTKSAEIGARQQPHPDCADKGKGEIAVPECLMDSFVRNPRRFLRDKASVLMIPSRSFVLRPDSFQINKTRKNGYDHDEHKVCDWFMPKEGTLYYSHNDLSLSRDKCVTCVGHQEGERSVIDLVFVIDPKKDGMVNLEEVRSLFYVLLDREFQFGKVTFDQFQSRDTMQRLQDRGVNTENFSVDRDLRAYNRWLEAHYSENIDVFEIEGYMEEARGLLQVGSKVDHGSTSSKDICDAVAGTVFHCRDEGASGMMQAEVLKRRGYERG